MAAHKQRNGYIVLGLLVIFVLVLLWGPTIYANLTTAQQRFDANTVELATIPERDVALVLGAGVLPSGEPTKLLRQRVETGVALYNAGRVEKILVSGDNRKDHYNEPEVMYRLAVQLGVPEGDVVRDYAGLSTYDSCYRAQAIFGVRSMHVVTQGYHLPRAVMTCAALGMDTLGVAAKREGRDYTWSYIAREWLSTGKAVIELGVQPNPTVLGKPEPIFAD